MTPLFRRVLTALIMLSVFVTAVLWAPGWLWSVMMAGVLGLAAFEWARLSGFPQLTARIYAVLLTLCALSLPYVLTGVWWETFQFALVLLALAFWLILAPWWLMCKWQIQRVFIRSALGVVILLPTWGALIDLHARGPAVLLGILSIVWIADTAAYFAGRKFGRRKLAPTISPGKTWEGVLGAWCALALYAGVLSFWAGLHVVSLILVVSGLLYFSVLGDLFESWIKRVAGMKDSGNILPGHGGVLDRIDALTSTLPIAMGMLMWLEYSL